MTVKEGGETVMSASIKAYDSPFIEMGVEHAWFWLRRGCSPAEYEAVWHNGALLYLSVRVCTIKTWPLRLRVAATSPGCAES